MTHVTKIDLQEVNAFFGDYLNKSMPGVVRDLVLSGTKLESGNLETQVIEWRHLRNKSPDIAKKIDAPTKGYNIPLLRNIQTPEHFVYDPGTGEYLGQFNVE